MESVLALKLKALNFEKEYQSLIDKFYINLSDELVTLEELIQILNFLSERGITIKKPSELKVVNNDFAFIQKQVEAIDSIGEIDAYIENPVRINDKSAIDRLRYLQSIEEPYKTPEGKYSSVPFSKRKFETKYGIVDFKKIGLPEKSTLTDDLSKQENIAIQQETPANNVQTPDEDIIITFPANQIVDETAPSQIPSDENMLNADSQIIQGKEMVLDVDPIKEILSKPQTIGLNDDTFARYEKLTELTQDVIISIYGEDELSDSVVDNLIKLVTNGVEDDRFVIYSAITYGKSLTDDEMATLVETIEKKVALASEMSIDLGRAA